jgi:hypothetical protein
MFTKTGLFEPLALTPLGFCLRGWMKSEINKINVGTPDELLASILDAAGLL